MRPTHSSLRRLAERSESAVSGSQGGSHSHPLRRCSSPPPQAGYPPFFDDSPFGIYQKILAGRRDTIYRSRSPRLASAHLGSPRLPSGRHECPRHFEPTAKELIRKLLTADRTKRIGSTKNGGGAEEIKKQKWYRGLNWAALYNKTMEPYIAPDVSSSDDTSHYEKFADSIEESGPLLAITKDTALFGSFTGAFGSI